MSKLRSVSTSIWSDPFIESLTPNEKLLFLYLITNDKTNMLGIYEATDRKISFETGIKPDAVKKYLRSFEKKGKVKRCDSYIILVNYMKHQNYNTNMKKSAIDVYNGLPKELKTKDLKINKSNPLEGFETLLNHYGMVRKEEVEYEEELEYESKGELKPKEEIVYPFTDDVFISSWNVWKDYKKKEHSFKFKSEASEQASLKDLQKKSGGNLNKAIAIIEQSIANGWKGFFDLKEGNNEISKTDWRAEALRGNSEIW